MAVLNSRVRFIKSNLPGVSMFRLSYDNTVAYEVPGTRGLSHLAEHLMCRCFNDKNEYIDANAIFSNASTHYTGVTVFFRGLTSRLLPLIQDIFGSGRFFDYLPSKDKFETEKNVVLQEYDMYFCQPDHAADLNILRKHFNYFHAIGCRQDIAECTYESFIHFYTMMFAVPTDAVLISDDLPYAHTLLDNIRSLPTMQCVNMLTDFRKLTRVEPGDSFKPEFFGSTTKETTILDWIEVRGLTCAMNHVIADLWGDGMSSPVFNEIREKRGLSYSPHVTPLSNLIPSIQIMIKTDPDNVETVRGIIEDMFSNAWDMFITKDRFETVMCKTIAQHELACADNTNVRSELTSHLYGSEIMPSLGCFKEITFDDVCKIHEEVISKAKWNIASAGETVEV